MQVRVWVGPFLSNVASCLSKPSRCVLSQAGTHRQRRGLRGSANSGEVTLDRNARSQGPGPTAEFVGSVRSQGGGELTTERTVSVE
jgi:hypothetical protein